MVTKTSQDFHKESSKNPALPGIPTGERFRPVLNAPLKFFYLQTSCGILVTDFTEFF